MGRSISCEEKNEAAKHAVCAEEWAHGRTSAVYPARNVSEKKICEQMICGTATEAGEVTALAVSKDAVNCDASDGEH